MTSGTQYAAESSLHLMWRGNCLDRYSSRGHAAHGSRCSSSVLRPSREAAARVWLGDGVASGDRERGESEGVRVESGVACRVDVSDSLPVTPLHFILQ